MTLPNKISTGLLIAALLLLSFGYINYERINWVAISKSINMKTGETYTLDFKSQRNGHYLLELDTEHTLGKTEQNCRLGIEHSWNINECTLYPEMLKLSWLIYEDEILINKGSSSDEKFATWGKHIITHLTKFNTIRNKTYRIKLIVDEKDDALSSTNPRIRASINYVAHKNAYVTKYFLYLASSILICTAFFTWFFGILYKRYKLKHNNTFKRDAK